MREHKMRSLRLLLFFQAEDGIRDYRVTGVQTCALPISTGVRPVVRSAPPLRDLSLRRIGTELDRKSVVEGKRVDLGGRRIIKKKKNHDTGAHHLVTIVSCPAHPRRPAPHGGEATHWRRSAVIGDSARVRAPRFFFFQAEDGIRDYRVTGVQTCALPISEMRSGRDWSQEPAFKNSRPG